MATSIPRTLKQKIAAISQDVDEILRMELQQVLRTLHDAGYPIGVLLAMSRLSLRLTGQLYVAIGRRLPSDNLFDRIEEAFKQHILPEEIRSYLHTIRILSNKADHDAEKIMLTTAEAENALHLFLRVLEWFYCECDQGPRLPRLYAAEPVPAVTLTHMRVRVAGRWPLDMTDFFKGRIREQETVGQRLADARTRLVSIIGRGGMGKTALACKVLQDLVAGHWPHTNDGPLVNGIVNLSTRTDGITLERLFLEFSQILSEDIGARLEKVWTSRDLSIDQKIGRLMEMFEQGLYIILLDNLEDLINDKGRLTDPELVAFLREALRGAWHGLRLLVTSRVALTLDEPALQRFDHHIELADGLSVEEGVQLLRELDPNGEYGTLNEPEAKLANLVRRTHGVPRALELTVAIMAENVFISLDEVATDFYTQDEVVQKLVEENYRLLSDDARKVMEALAIYSVPVPQLAIDFLLRPFAPELDVPTVLRRLAHSHVVHIDRAAKLTWLHPIDQEYLYQQLPMQGSYSQLTLHVRAAEYFHSCRTVQPDGHFCLESSINCYALEPQLAEFQHWVKAEQLDKAGEILADFGPALVFGGSASRCHEMHQALLGQVKSDRARLGVLACETALRTMLGPVALALTIGEQARELAHQLGLLKEEAGIETMLGIACRYMVDTSQAIIHFERARALYKACNDTIREAYRLGDLSLCYSYIGNIKQALDYAHRLLQFAQRSQDMRATVAAHDALSLACVARGQWEEAIGHGEAVLAAWQSGMHDGKAYVLNTIGLAHFCAGRYAQAIDALRRGVIVAAELESLRAKGFCLYNLALMHYMHGNMAEVRQPAVEAQPSLSASGLAEQGTVVLALLDAVADADRTIEIRVLLTQARHLANNPDLFPARVLATHARDLAENLGLTDLAESAQQCIDDLVAKLILPDA